MSGVPPRMARRRLVAVAVVAAVVTIDQATKSWAVAELADGPVRIVGGDVQLRLARNSGGAFSLLQGDTVLLAVVAIVMAAVLVVLARRARDPRILTALALLLGGALGNLADRMLRPPRFLHGEVVDFIDVGSWPTFNVADSAITVGVVLLLLDTLLTWRAERTASRTGAAR